MLSPKLQEDFILHCYLFDHQEEKRGNGGSQVSPCLSSDAIPSEWASFGTGRSDRWNRHTSQTKDRDNLTFENSAAAVLEKNENEKSLQKFR